jgi:hypothetical protein
VILIVFELISILISFMASFGNAVEFHCSLQTNVATGLAQAEQAAELSCHFGHVGSSCMSSS